MPEASTSLEQLARLSRRAGERSDLVQAGGGNTSWKSAGRMWIKASGLRLSDVRATSGIALVDNDQLLSGLRDTDWSGLDRAARESTAAELVAKAARDGARPSIETLLHSLLEGFVLHTHPVTVNAAFKNDAARSRAVQWLPDCAFVDYHTPGIDLALAVRAVAEGWAGQGKRPRAFLLSHHGLLVAGPSVEIVLEETEQICAQLAERLSSEAPRSPASGLSLELTAHQFCGRISKALEEMTGDPWVTMLSEETGLPWPSEVRPFFPDGVVFLGAGPLQTQSDRLAEDIRAYLQLHGIPPRMIRCGGRNYFAGSSYSRARDGEEVWRLHVLAAGSDPQCLPADEVRYLSHWEAEKYRQKL